MTPVEGWKATLVTLVGGEMVWSDAELWRHESEARSLLRYPRHAREQMLAKIQDSRGARAVEQLRVTMDALKASDHAAPAPSSAVTKASGA